MMLRAGRHPAPYLDSVTVPGRLVEVVALEDRRDFALRAPSPSVRIAQGQFKGDLLWVAQQYVRPGGTPPPKGEARLPEFRMVPAPTSRGRASAEPRADDRVQIPLGRDLRLPPNRRRRGRRGRRLGGEEAGRGDPLPDDIQVDVARRHPFKAVEGRLLDGPHAGEYVWGTSGTWSSTTSGSCTRRPRRRRGGGGGDRAAAPPVVDWPTAGTEGIRAPTQAGEAERGRKGGRRECPYARRTSTSRGVATEPALPVTTSQLGNVRRRP